MRLVIALAVALALAACDTGDAPPQQQAARDAGALATPEPQPSIEDRGFIAVIAPARSIDVQPPFAGELAEVHVRAGDVVDEGDLIATLESRPLKERLRSAEAAYGQARARYRSERVAVNNAERRLERARKDFADGIGSERDVQDADAALDTARAARDQASSAVKAAKADVDTAKRNMSETKITADFAGTISMRYRDPGAAVGPGLPVVRLIATGSLWVRFAIPPDRREAISVGDTVRVDIDGVEATAEAVVKQISPELDPASKMIFAEAELVLPAGLSSKIQPGMEAWVN